MGKPSNWYSMSYSERQEWEKNDRAHQRELDDADYDRRRAEDDARAARQRADRAQREANGRIEEMELELEEVRERLTAVARQKSTLIKLLGEIEAALEDRYDGAPDSSTRWMGEFLAKIKEVAQ